jgi:NADPH:quinone reductase-like Zn-dependent oxidoreductase
MKAVALTRYLPIDDPESLVDVELPRPTASGHDLLVRVEAVSVNPVDTKVRSPKAQIEPQPKVLGYDASGVVEAVGESVSGFSVGDRVYYPARQQRAVSAGRRAHCRPRADVDGRRGCGGTPADHAHRVGAAVPAHAVR